MSGKSRRHHVVSQGYQRNFAVGKRLLLIDKTTRVGKLVGTRDAFHADHFNSRLGPGGWDDTLERAWGRLEALALPALRRLDARQGDSDDRNVAKVAVALHLARSFTFAEIHERVSTEVAQARGPLLAKDRRALQAFRAQYGRPPAAGEIERIAVETMAKMKASRGPFVQRMGETYNRIIRRIAQLNVQLLAAPPALGWVTGDTPVLLSDSYDLKRLHGRGDLAILEAGHWWMPVGPRVGLTFYSSRPAPDDVALPMTCQTLNWAMWRNCQRFVACHPDHDPSRLLATTITRA